jgi:hypothetical protein
MLLHYTLWVGRYEPLFVALITVTIDNACSTLENGCGCIFFFLNDKLRVNKFNEVNDLKKSTEINTTVV